MWYHSSVYAGQQSQLVSSSIWMRLSLMRTHRKWLWNTTPTDDLYRIEDGDLHHDLPLQGTHRMRLIMAYTQTWKEKIHKNYVMGSPILDQDLNDMHVNKMSTGPPLAKGPQQPSNFWEFLRSWGGRVDVGKNRGQLGHETRSIVADTWQGNKLTHLGNRQLI